MLYIIHVACIYVYVCPCHQTNIFHRNHRFRSDNLQNKSNSVNKYARGAKCCCPVGLAPGSRYHLPGYGFVVICVGLMPLWCAGVPFFVGRPSGAFTWGLPEYCFSIRFVVSAALFLLDMFVCSGTAFGNP